MEGSSLPGLPSLGSSSVLGRMDMSSTVEKSSRPAFSETAQLNALWEQLGH